MKKPREFSNPKYTQISLYVVLTFIALLVTYAIFGNMPALMAGAGRLIAPLAVVVTPLVGGLVIAYLLLPPVKRLQGFLLNVPVLSKRTGLTRVLSIVVTVAVLVAIVLLCLALVTATIVGEVQQLDLSHLDRVLETIGAAFQQRYREFETWLAAVDVSSEQLGTAVSHLSDSLAGMLDDFGGQMLTGSPNSRISSPTCSFPSSSPSI